MNVKTVSFTISSSQKEEQSRVRDTVMKLLCVCTQAMIKIADMLWYDPVSLSLSLSFSLSAHTHTHDAQNYAC